MVRSQRSFTTVVTAALLASFTGGASAQGILHSFYGNPGDLQGHAVSGAGDVDQDGVDDVIAGAPYNNLNGAKSGAARVFSGASGAVLHTFYGDSASDQFGWSVSGAGDVNQDGFDDVIVGAVSDSTAGYASGSAFVYSGLNGSLLHAFHGTAATEMLGRSVSGAGDVNQDGFDDVIVGAVHKNNHGAALVYSGKDGSLLYTFQGDANGTFFGIWVSGADDVNADSYPDLVVGDHTYNLHGANSGAVWVFSGKTGAKLHSFYGDAAEDRLGYCVGDAGDVNKDGYADVIAGAFQDDNTGADAGSARVYSGKDGSILYHVNGDAAGNWFGHSVDGAGDVNGDGYADFLAGAPYASPGGANAGRVRVYSGATGSVLFTLDGTAGDRLGWSVSGTGDVNGDGRDDFAAGASTEDTNGYLAGAALVYGGVPCPGSVSSYGAGCPGSGGFTPSLALLGCASPGSLVTLEIENGLGGVLAFLFVGLNAVSIPAGGSCTLLVDPIPLILPLPLGGSGAGEGAISVPAQIPSGMANVLVRAQAFLPDPGGVPGFSTTNGLHIDIRN
ncbi:MAG: FG-GAP repeat protein [Planctomycetes bacterium]|nr:FG-GAP repeat protein [Planctomycetota bacterium]